MNQEGYELTEKLENANLVLVNTCSIREKLSKPLEKGWNFLMDQTKNKDLKIGVLGCMAERLKHKFLEEEKMVDIVVGPDAYKDLPNFLREAEAEREAVNVILSKEETYGDIAPCELATNGVLLCQSLEDVTTCVLFVWFHLQGGEKEVVTQKAYWRKLPNWPRMDIKKLHYWDKM